MTGGERCVHCLSKFCKYFKNFRAEMALNLLIFNKILAFLKADRGIFQILGIVQPKKLPIENKNTAKNSGCTCSIYVKVYA